MLAELLRAERVRAGTPTYEQMAAGSEVSAATLKRAASGRSTPSQQTIFAYLLACGSRVSILERANTLRLKARRDERGGRRKVFVEGISTPAALLDGLAALHVNLGARPYEEMQERAGGAHMLPLSSISRILNREMLPVDEKQMNAFIQGCGVLDRDREKWMEAWHRVKGTDSRALGLRAEVLFRSLSRRERHRVLVNVLDEASSRRANQSEPHLTTAIHSVLSSWSHAETVFERAG
ncbi:hypothetical protein ACFC0K_37790 [Streptomyces hydrogenans]|uniref:hypothetical protein n=1 Tax=Streptomyces hydrogenans TaxID=1873719 RepID=UPI0035DB2C4E